MVIDNCVLECRYNIFMGVATCFSLHNLLAVSENGKENSFALIALDCKVAEIYTNV